MISHAFNKFQCFCLLTSTTESECVVFVAILQIVDLDLTSRDGGRPFVIVQGTCLEVYTSGILLPSIRLVDKYF